ncbi:MAG: glycosyl hydrolase [Xanthobacteraceae bacterium]|nr:glycosyl hydrolase [Xanthobacteraceae bacterium]
MNVLNPTDLPPSVTPSSELAALPVRVHPPFAVDWEPDATVDAAGGPGISPAWTSSTKDAVGGSLGNSRLWFTLGYGIVNEVYWPRTDIPQIRDLGFVVAGEKGFWSEVKRNGDYNIRPIAAGVPAFEIEHKHARYVLRLRITPDPRRDVLLIESNLESEDPNMGLFVLLAPHLAATGHNNRAMVARHRGRNVLWAENSPFALALAAVDEKQVDAIVRASCGYVGSSDGWQDFARNGAMTWHNSAAGPGNVALIAELSPRCTMALGFGSSREAASTLAVSSLMQPFQRVLDSQVSDWLAWHRNCAECCARPKGAAADLEEQFVISAAVLRNHLDKTYPGAMVASLSIPWGDSGDERGGYHLVWPRDLVECAGALLAFGSESEARDTLRYLIATQNSQGHWYQNQWLGGHPSWSGIQLDEVAFPVLLAGALAQRNALGGIQVESMVRRALSFVASHGPAADQDRWEENAGLNSFTLASCIAAFVVGSAFLDQTAARWALAIADFWNAGIEQWMVARDTELARQVGVSSYYVRTAPASVLEIGSDALQQTVPIRNRADVTMLAAHEQISTDFLQLVRFGLRSPNDPLIQNSIKVVDHLLKVDTPSGTVWRRYNEDGYGEHEDGSAYDGTGRGRPWPLLAGERGHFELVAGQDPLPFLKTMAACASTGGMIPEQIWDASPVRQRHLHPGRPTGSAMPLAWAHAEFIKLAASRSLGHPFDRPKATWDKYRGEVPAAGTAFWWPHAPIQRFAFECRVVIALPRLGTVRWGTNGWQSITETQAEETGLGFYAVVLDTSALSSGQRVDFTIRWANGDWIGADFSLQKMSSTLGS